MIESRPQAAKHVGRCYHTIRFWEARHGLTYPCTEERLMEIMAGIAPRKRDRRRKYKYELGKRGTAIGNRIRTARKAKRLNQWGLASMAGISRGSVAYYETGATTPGDDIIERLAKVLEVDAEWLRK